MMRLPKDFKELLQLLNSKGIEYLVVGGYAVALYGYPRATGDMDIWVAISKENASKIVEVLKEFGFDMPELKEELFMASGKNIRMGTPPLRIEILTSIDGVEFSDCLKRKKNVNIDDLEISFISFDDLILNKKATGRYKDLADIDNLKGQ
ncbi:MAG: nucleotidyltransferase [Candidatus Omnitrophica bacterium]|nr:nucleotidyltransferase [Candidatus Omnitrophota bacterium]